MKRGAAMESKVLVDSKVLAEMKLENFRRNRETCPPAHRSGFDQLISIAQAELNNSGSPERPGRVQPRPALPGQPCL
jgi:hypothetical protein